MSDEDSNVFVGRIAAQFSFTDHTITVVGGTGKVLDGDTKTLALAVMVALITYEDPRAINAAAAIIDGFKESREAS